MILYILDRVTLSFNYQRDIIVATSKRQGESKMDQVPATKPTAPKAPWNKKDKLIAQKLVEWIGWTPEELERHIRAWSHGRLGRKDITQDHIKAVNKYLRDKIVEEIGEDGIDEFINNALKREGIE